MRQKTEDRRQKTEIWLYYKPVNIITSRVAQGSAKTIYDDLPASLHHLKYIGRLDQMSEGLLLLTNDGELANQLSFPINKITKKYQVYVYGRVDINRIKKVLSSLKIDGHIYNNVEII